MSAQPLLIDRIAWIESLEDRPALRNLLITQCYHDLSHELVRVLGPENVNWCTFATWASKTAGRFIRNDEVPQTFRSMLADSVAFKRSAARAIDGLKGVHATTTLHEASLVDAGETVAGEVSGQITAGNLKVFSELAPVFAEFISLFHDGQIDEVAAVGLFDSLKVGRSAEGGQSLLRQAMEHLLAAAKERDPKRRAAWMLLANAQTGLHEQIRLQPYIAGSLDAPIDETLGQLVDRHHAGVGSSLLGRIHASWDRLGHAVVGDMKAVWDDLATKELMTLAIPGQLLHLGSALPPPQGLPLYPALLESIENQQVESLLEQYAALDPRAEGEVGAADWTALTQRMRYIIGLFRSRQCVPSMLEPPFSEAQRAALINGEVPAGPL